MVAWMRNASSSKIGVRISALQRLRNFCERYRDYFGRNPSKVILFAEDYDALLDAFHARDLRLKDHVPQNCAIERGPSIQEYAQ